MEIVFGSKDDTSLDKKQTLTKLEVGNSSILAEKEESKTEEPRIALDSVKIDEILDLCIKDLKYPRTINGKNIILVTDYNDKTKIITFGEKIETLQKLLKIKETSIGEFFSWYFVSNFRKYCKEKFKALPESLPIYSIEEINQLTIRIDFA